MGMDEPDSNELELADPVAPSDCDEGLEAVTFHIRHDLQKRLDIYLRDRLSTHSRSMLQKLIKSGTVLVNGRPAKASTLLRSGDCVELKVPPTVQREILPENIPLDILYEDDDFIAINKPTNLIVHPARGHWTGTMTNALVHHALQTAGTLSMGSDPWRPGIIHRLDRNTTGLILVAKTDEAHWRLAGQFERRSIRKTYLAVIHGSPPLDSDLIDAPVGVHPTMREKYTVREDIGRTAQTVYQVKERFKHFTLLELFPKTGRTHQLRVHLSHVGYPIVGDIIYGGRAVSRRDITGNAADPTDVLISRQALHAWKLQFVHPSKFNRMALEAPIPSDMSEFLTILRQFDR
jgi:23S rRNA pseudouridine1911/1915/1917 synthase